MQTANGTFILSPENHQPVYGVTPAECLIFYRMHRANANGSPLGDFFVQSGEAETVDVPAKPEQQEERDLLSGTIKPAREAIPAVTHKRTQQEEIARLKKKFTGLIAGEDGRPQTAFIATFGSAAGVRLPETFEEIQEIVGIQFRSQAEESAVSANRERTQELAKKSRPEIAQMAIAEFGLQVHPADSKEFIIAAIINEQNKRNSGVADATAEKQPKSKRGAKDGE